MPSIILIYNEGVMKMFITDEARNELQLLLDDHQAKGIRLTFAGIG